MRPRTDSPVVPETRPELRLEDESFSAARRDAEAAALASGELPALDRATRFLPRALLGLDTRPEEEPG